MLQRDAVITSRSGKGRMLCYGKYLLVIVDFPLPRKLPAVFARLVCIQTEMMLVFAIRIELKIVLITKYLYRHVNGILLWR
jgi:hypothetical protein